MSTSNPVSDPTRAARVALDPTRAARAALAVSEDRVRIKPLDEDAYEVGSFTGEGSYRVGPSGCNCPDAMFRPTLCKHEIALRLLGPGGGEDA